MMNGNNATQLWQICCHNGPRAKEVFIHCRSDTSETGILDQTASVYRSLIEALQQEGGTGEHVLHEIVFFRDIQRDLFSYMNARPGNSLYTPAATFIQQAPTNEGQLIELSAYAVIPKSGSDSICSIAGLPPQQTGRILMLGGRKHLFLSNICGFPNYGNSFVNRRTAPLFAGEYFNCVNQGICQKVRFSPLKFPPFSIETFA